MLKQLFNDLMSVPVTRWGIYATVMFIATSLISWAFQSPTVDWVINIAYLIFVAAFLYVAWNEHVKESHEEQARKVQKSKGK